MFKKVFLLIFALLLPALGMAIVREVDRTSDGFRVKYRLDSPTVMRDTVSNTIHFEMPGFGTTSEVGRPYLPCKTESFEIPMGYRVKDYVVSVTTDTIQGVCAPVVATPFESENGSTVSVEIPTLEPFQGVWPGENAMVECGSAYRGLQIGFLTIYPIRYDYEAQRSILSKEIEVNISFEEVGAYRVASSVRQIVTPEEREALLDIAFSSDESASCVQSISPPLISDGPEGCYEAPTYLIVCPTEFKTAAEKLATWKRRIGYNVEIEDKSIDYLLVPENTDALIKQHYAEDNRLEYVLLLGGGYQIAPWTGKYPYEGTEYMTDLYFACMDGENDLIPDVLLGRLPAHSLADANAMVDKTISYEKEPALDNDAYFNTGLHVSKFYPYQDIERDTYIPPFVWADVIDANFGDALFIDKKKTEGRHFVKTSEEIISYLSDTYVSKRAYKANDDQYPKYWSPKFAYDYEMPQEIQKPNLAWDASFSSIKNELNNGVRYVLYRAHGGVDRWDDKLLTVDTCASLTNGRYLPIFFNTTCLTGVFRLPHEIYMSNGQVAYLYNSEKYSLSEALLTASNGGAVGVIGANQVSMSGYNDYFTAAMFDAMHPYPGLKISLRDPKLCVDAPTLDPERDAETRLGAVMNKGMQRTFELLGSRWGSSGNVGLRYTHEVFHCLGDPSVRIHLSKPIKKAPMFSSRDRQQVVRESRQLVLVDKSTKKVYLKNSILTSFNLNDYADYHVSLIQDGYVPYLFRNLLLSDPSSALQLQYVDNGTSVTVSYDEVESEVSARCCDIYGNTYSRARGESGELCIDRPSAACVVIVECDEMPVETIKLTPKN